MAGRRLDSHMMARVTRLPRRDGTCVPRSPSASSARRPSRRRSATSPRVGGDVPGDSQMLLEADTLVYDNDADMVTAVGGVQDRLWRQPAGGASA